MWTAGPAVAIALSADRSKITSDGRDLAFVTVTAVDSCGHRVPDSRNVVRFTISGSGSLAAAANGDPTGHDSFQASQCRVFHGQCLLIVRAMESNPGPIRLSAESDSLKSGTLILNSQ